ncbi:hypothetical protein [Pedobacter mendelii]|uniref:Auto-transporter adhesin head GIN domain-containing protein n=1 Tax=Pedobacter mendelii TaxID=1908240 RepID=A0ABQ2BFL3_9SPHI|nr:hypothetical protein [Pedobacter mendelii]GGI23009.1 hypothetical protein GCM10008119_05520 [Pedobacter mendelii]
MKTSNKLLISLAISLILIPIIVIAVNVKTNYIQADKLTQNNKNLEDFNIASPNFVLHKLDKSFDKINIIASKKTILKVTIVENPNTGLKISDNEENNTGAFVDKNGVLQISNKNLKDNQTVFLSLVIFSPKINQLSIKDALQLEFHATAKQLNLNLKNLQSMFFQNTKISQLNIIGDNLKNFFQDDNNIDKLYLNLNNSQFKASKVSYKILDIVLTGNSKISIEGDEVNKEKYKIDSLYINTKGKSDLKLENIKVNKSSGNLSDSTTVNMSAAVLKTMFK